jgi:hypothetical protein
MPAARLEQVGEADEVRLDIRLRVREREAHAGLCGEVKHGIRLRFLNEIFHGMRNSDVDLVEPKAAVLQLRKPIPLELHRIVGRQVVDADHLVAALEQAPRAMHADEAGDASDENFHCTICFPTA